METTNQTAATEFNPGPVNQTAPTLAQLERITILERLQANNGNRTHTAKSLGISIRTLRNKLVQYRTEGYAV